MVRCKKTAQYAVEMVDYGVACRNMPHDARISCRWSGVNGDSRAVLYLRAE